MNKHPIATAAFVLATLGAVNWGLVGLWGYDVVAEAFDDSSVASALYILVGLSGVYLLFERFAKN